MQEIKKRRIVIASVLKPVDDTRMFEKMGISLAPFYKVDIIGYPSTKPPDTGAIDFHPLPPFHRLSLGRILAPFRILFRTLILKPDLFIITTHELLFAAFTMKFLRGSKIIYDVRENYRRNILHTNTFPLILRPLLASWVAMKEWFGRLYVDHYFLAEDGYREELFFPTGKFTVLENKFRRPQNFAERKDRRDGTIRLLFSGTLNEGTGIFTAIDLSEKLHALSDKITLTIIGYCAQGEVLAKIRKAISNKSYVTLVGGDTLVPHEEILNAIQESDFGIVSYPPNPSTINSVPTKLYEYMACRLPIIMIQHPAWVRLAAQHHAAIIFHPDNLDPPKIMTAIQHDRFYPTDAQDVYWETGEIVRIVANVIEYATPV